MPRFPGDLVAKFEQTTGDAAYRALTAGRRRTDMRGDVAREVKTTLRWRIDRGRDANRRHGVASNSRLFDLELTRDAVELALPLVATFMESFSEARRQRLLFDEVAVALEHARNWPRIPERNAIGDVQARLLPHVVQVVRELAREPFELELRRDLSFER